MSEPIVYEQHCHTPLCKHAEGEPVEYCAAAVERGLAGIVLTDHNPMPDSYGHFGRMKEDQLELYQRMVSEARSRYRDRLDVRLGLECDFFPGYEQYVERTLEGRAFNHVLGSVHCQLPIWRRRFEDPDDPEVTQRNYFEQVARAAESGLFDTMAHPDLVKNTTAEGWRIERIMDAVGDCLDRVAAAGCAMELNTSGLLKHIPEMNPNPAMLLEMHKREIPVVVGADAHVPQRVAEDFEGAYDLLEAVGYTHVSYFLDRRRYELPIAVARASLRPVEMMNSD